MSASETYQDDPPVVVAGECCREPRAGRSDQDRPKDTAGPSEAVESPRPASDRSGPSETEPLAMVTFNVGGMNCASCARRLTGALGQLPGVEQVFVDFDSRRAMVGLKPETTLNGLQAAVENEGYRFWGAMVEVVDPGSNPLLEPTLDNGPGEGPPEAVETGPADYCAPDDSGPTRTGWRPYVFGLIAAVAVVGFYLGLVTLTSNWYFARAQFGDYYGWILALALGLGVQVTLFSKFRAGLRRKGRRAAGSTLAASGGVSAASMAACCAHYLAAFLPALGLSFLSGAAAALEKYQSEFFLVGVLSNLFGIWLMLGMMARHGVITVESSLARRVLRVRRLA